MYRGIDSECAELLPALPVVAPAADALGGLELAVGSGADDGIPGRAEIEKPLGVLGGHSDAAMRDIGTTQRTCGPWGGVNELTGVGETHGVLHLEVVIIRTSFGEADPRSP